MRLENIAPTRRNYLEIQKALVRTQEGYDLLEQIGPPSDPG